MKWAWCLLLLFQSALAQTNTGDDKAPQNDVSGNPFLFRDWADGIIKYPSGRVVNQFRLKFDCAQNLLILQFQGSAFGAESKVQSFTIYSNERKKKDSLVFRKGFPPSGKGSTETFYQVLLEDKTVLLKLFIKNIMEEKQIASETVRRHYEDEEEYFLLKDGRMIILPADKESFLGALPDKSTELRRYMNEQQIRLRTADDFIKVITRYNQLL